MWRKPGQLTRTIFVGNEYGRLRVLSRAANRRNIAWIVCECAKDIGGCGTIKEVGSIPLTSGLTKSCGCLRVDTIRKNMTTHGGTTYEYRAPEYSPFASMKSRCFNQKDRKYPRYGARGIYVCDGWRDNFGAFRADMGPRPSVTHSIDRVNNEGSYTCGKCPQCVERGAVFNCRWATKKEQARNTSSCVLITLNGETLDAASWADRLGIQAGTLLYRHHAGYPVEKVLSVESLPSARFVKGHSRSPRGPRAVAMLGGSDTTSV